MIPAETQITVAPQTRSHLRVVKSASDTETNQLIEAVLTVAISTFWNKETFSWKERLQMKELIAAYFDNHRTPKENFINLTERICLAKRYVCRKRERYIPKPLDWLNIHYPLGLAGTSTWMDRVNEMRKKVPYYNLGIHTLAQGILRQVQSPSQREFLRYKGKLIRQQQYDLLPIYYYSILNLQYNS